jgi:hypothetical protein
MLMPRAVSQLRPREILHLSVSQQPQRGIRIAVLSRQRIIRGSSETYSPNPIERFR